MGNSESAQRLPPKNAVRVSAGNMRARVIGRAAVTASGISFDWGTTSIVWQTKGSDFCMVELKTLVINLELALS